MFYLLKFKHYVSMYGFHVYLIVQHGVLCLSWIYGLAFDNLGKIVW